MGILNYTTTISVAKTLGEMQRILADHGARAILVEYDESREPCGLAFQIPTQYGDRSFRLPANLDGIHRTLQAQARAGKIAPRFSTRDQAARTGWRILKTWVEAQMAIIEAGMVTLVEVMLPYMETRPGGRSVYEELLETKLLLPEYGGTRPILLGPHANQVG